MRNIVVLVSLALSLAACMTPAQMEQANLAKDDRTCRSYGVLPGSNPYVACRMNLAQGRTARDIAESQSNDVMMVTGLAMMQGSRY